MTDIITSFKVVTFLAAYVCLFVFYLQNNSKKVTMDLVIFSINVSSGIRNR